MLKKIGIKVALVFTILAVSLSAFVLVSPNPVQADTSIYNHIIPFTITDTSGVARTNVPVIITYDTNGKLVAYGLVNATATNTYIDSTGASNSPVGTGTALSYCMATSNITAIIPSLPAYGSVTINLYTGYSPSASGFPIITGNNGYITTTNSATLDIGSSGNLTFSGYFNPPSTGYLWNIPTVSYNFIGQGDGSGHIAAYFPGTYPLISSNTTGGDAGATVANVPVTIPAGTASGDELIAVINAEAVAASPTISVPPGWAQSFQSATLTDNRSTLGVFYKVATGSEVTTNFPVSPNSDYTFQCFRIATGTYSGVPVAGVTANGSSTHPAPPSLTTGFGTATTMFMVMNGNDGYATTAAPTGYVGLLSVSSVSTNAYSGTAEKYTFAASDTPSTFTLGSTSAWSANTIAIKGAPSSTSPVISAGVHNIAFYVTGGNAGWVIDGSDTHTAYASSIPASNSTISFCTSNIMAYENYIQVYKGASNTLWYQPTGLISGTTLPDRAGSNTGTIVWGTNSGMTVTGGDIMTSASATSLGMTSALLQSSFDFIGTYSSVYLSFQYGLTTSYGYWTSETVSAVAQSYSVSLTGLTPNTTYHYRAIARNGVVYSYGADITFTTSYSSSSQGSTTPIIVSAGVFNSYSQNGDMLVCAEIILTYPPYYPTKTPADYFQLQLVSTNGSTLLGSSPVQQWGDRPESIYFNPTLAATLTYGSAYYIRIASIGSANVSNTNYALTGADWHGSNLVQLDNWCISAATNMQLTDGSTYLATASGYGIIINDSASGYFTTGINGIAQIRPNLFSTSQTVNSLPTLSSAQNYNSGSTLSGRVGTQIVTDATTVGSILGINANQLLLYGILAVVLGCIIFTVSSTNGFGSLGALCLAVPVMGASVYFNIVSITMFMVFGVVMIVLWVRQMFIKTL